MMTRLCANLSMLFNEYPFMDRFAAAAKAGFRGVEYLFPYTYDVGALAEKLEEHRMTQVLFNLPAGNWENGERGIAIYPDRIDEFQAGVYRAIEYAKKLNCTQLNVLAGIISAEDDRALFEKTFLQNIRFAADALKKEGISLLVEAINHFDIPGFFINHTDDTARLIKAAARDNILIQYDVYHMQRMEGELCATLKKYQQEIAHIQVADNPGRNEPGTGEINFPFLFSYLNSIDYSGWIGCEYNPAANTESGLVWAHPYLEN